MSASATSERPQSVSCDGGNGLVTSLEPSNENLGLAEIALADGSFVTAVMKVTEE
jgi:hypothetical protein